MVPPRLPSRSTSSVPSDHRPAARRTSSLRFGAFPFGGADPTNISWKSAPVESANPTTPPFWVTWNTAGNAGPRRRKPSPPRRRPSPSPPRRRPSMAPPPSREPRPGPNRPSPELRGVPGRSLREASSRHVPVKSAGVLSARVCTTPIARAASTAMPAAIPITPARAIREPSCMFRSGSGCRSPPRFTCLTVPGGCGRDLTPGWQIAGSCARAHESRTRHWGVTFLPRADGYNGCPDSGMGGACMSQKILVVEDDSRIASLLVKNLEASGYECHVSPDGGRALADFARLKPALVVLDLGLAGVDGLEVARSIRRESDTPVLM